MPKKIGFSKRALKVIECVWYAVSLLIAMNLKNNLNLGLWGYLCIAVPLIMVGEFLIRKFTKSTGK